MSLWRSLSAGLRTLLRKDVVERELDDELRHYLEMATLENMRAGMSRTDAERAARVKIGGIEANKHDVRSGGWEASIASLGQDVRVAIRGLRHSPGFALIAVASLALGVGVNTAMFSVMNAVMFRPLPYRNASELALIWTNDVQRGIPRELTPYLTITDWAKRTRTFEDVAYFSTQRVSPTSFDPSRGRTRSRAALVSENLFPLIGVTPIKGRLVSAADIRDRAPVAVISYEFWQRWFDGREDVVGSTFGAEGVTKAGMANWTVIGVLPQGFFFPDKLTEIWTPATTYWRFDSESTERFYDWARRWTAVGRLADGRTMADAREDLSAIGQQLATLHPSTMQGFPGFATTVVPVLDTYAGTNLQSTLWVLLGAVAVVLLVVCANIANLQLARGAARQREFAVRRALGASRGRIIRQLIAESLVLVIIGGAVGAAIAILATPMLASWASQYLPRMDEIALDWRVLTFAAGASLLCGVVFGLMPAIRLSSADANEALREGARGTGNASLRRNQGVLVLAECALALVLLTGAGLLLKSLNRLQSVNPGFDASSVLTVRVEFPPVVVPMASGGGPDAGQLNARSRAQVATSLLDHVRELPGVASAGFTDDMFIAGQGNESIAIPGRTELPAGELNGAMVSPGFFETMRVPLKGGRYPNGDDVSSKIHAMYNLVLGVSLAEKERRATAEAVVVNESFVKRYFPNEDPVGKRFCFDPEGKTYWFTIVGVVGDMQRGGLQRPAIPEFFGSYIPAGNGRADLVVRTQGDARTMASMLRNEVARAVPSIVVVNIATVEQGLDGFTAQRRLQTWLLTVFAGLALMLASVGIFGLAHYAVAERTREIGVRVALGATHGDVIRMVILQGMRMPALGIVVGLIASLGLTRVLASQLYDTRATDPLTFGVVAAMLAAVAASACYIAARRAARADPVRALKEA